MPVSREGQHMDPSCVATASHEWEARDGMDKLGVIPRAAPERRIGHSGEGTQIGRIRVLARYTE